MGHNCIHCKVTQMVSKLSTPEAYNIIARMSCFQFQFTPNLLPASEQIDLSNSSNVTVAEAVQNAFNQTLQNIAPDIKHTALVIADDANISQECLESVATFLSTLCPRVYIINGVELNEKYPFLFSVDFFKHMYPSEIRHDLFLSGRGSVDAHVLSALGITSVVSILDRPFSAPVADHVLFRAADSSCADIVPVLRQATAHIQRAHAEGRKVLVHCEQGRSRSVSVVVAYLMRAGGCGTVDEALALVKACRPEAQPNDNFMEQLHIFQHNYLNEGQTQNDMK